MCKALTIVCAVVLLAGCESTVALERRPYQSRVLTLAQFDWFERCASTRGYGYRIESVNSRAAYCMTMLDVVWALRAKSIGEEKS